MSASVVKSPGPTMVGLIVGSGCKRMSSTLSVNSA